jgi:hypothetical protein
VTRLAGLPTATVVDGEIVAFAEDGRPFFNPASFKSSAPDSVEMGPRECSGENIVARRSFEDCRGGLPLIIEPNLGPTLQHG